MKLYTILTLLILLFTPLSSGLSSESENYKIDFTVKPSFESWSDNFYITSVLNPVSGNTSTNATSIYQGFLLIPAIEQVIIQEQIQVGGGGGGAVYQESKSQKEQIEEQILEITCGKDTSFIRRLFSGCKIPDNQVCDDGENFLINSDCKLNIDNIKNGEILKTMWFLRAILLFSIFMLFKDSKKYPIIIAVLVLLFVYNGAFITPETAYNKLSCTDVYFIINLGYCIIPTNPLIGWVIGISIIVLLLSYFNRERKPRVGRQNRKVYK